MIDFTPRFYFSVHLLVYVSIEKVYQTLETASHQLSKHLEKRKAGIFKFLSSGERFRKAFERLRDGLVA